MGAILTGSIIYFVIWILAAFLIQEKVTRDEKDEKLIKEYRG